MGLWVDSMLVGAALMSLAGTIMFSGSSRGTVSYRGRMVQSVGTIVTAGLVTLFVVRAA